MGDPGLSKGQGIFPTILVFLISLKSSEPFYCLTILNNVYPQRTYLRDVIYPEGWGQLVSVTE